MVQGWARGLGVASGRIKKTVQTRGSQALRAEPMGGGVRLCSAIVARDCAALSVRSVHSNLLSRLCQLRQQR